MILLINLQQPALGLSVHSFRQQAVKKGNEKCERYSFDVLGIERLMALQAGLMK
jgi:hypothetical protein